MKSYDQELFSISLTNSECNNGNELSGDNNSRMTNSDPHLAKAQACNFEPLHCPNFEQKYKELKNSRINNDKKVVSNVKGPKSEIETHQQSSLSRLQSRGSKLFNTFNSLASINETNPDNSAYNTSQLGHANAQWNVNDYAKIPKPAMRLRNKEEDKTNALNSEIISDLPKAHENIIDKSKITDNVECLGLGHVKVAASLPSIYEMKLSGKKKESMSEYFELKKKRSALVSYVHHRNTIAEIKDLPTKKYEQNHNLQSSNVKNYPYGKIDSCSSSSDFNSKLNLTKAVQPLRRLSCSNASLREKTCWHDATNKTMSQPLKREICSITPLREKSWIDARNETTSKKQSPQQLIRKNSSNTSSYESFSDTSRKSDFCYPFLNVKKVQSSSSIKDYCKLNFNNENKEKHQYDMRFELKRSNSGKNRRSSFTDFESERYFLKMAQLHVANSISLKDLVVSARYENYSADNLYSMMKKMDHIENKKRLHRNYCKREIIKNPIHYDLSRKYCKREVLQSLEHYDLTSEKVKYEIQIEKLPLNFDENQFEIVDGLIQFTEKKTKLQRVRKSIQNLARTISSTKHSDSNTTAA